MGRPVDAFFDQVTPDFLKSERVQSLCFFTLREAAEYKVDKHDDDRSNMAVLRRSGLPRLDPATFERLMDFMSATTDTPRRQNQASIKPMPAWARKKYSPRGCCARIRGAACRLRLTCSGPCRCSATTRNSCCSG